MTNYYKILYLTAGTYNCLVVCLSYKSIFNYFDNLQNELKSNGIFDANILIDQLLISGNNNNRFLSILLSKGEFVYTSAKNVKPGFYYNQLTSNVFTCDQMILQNSILTNKEVSSISKGNTI